MRIAAAVQPCPPSPLGKSPAFLCSSSCLLLMLLRLDRADARLRHLVPEADHWLGSIVFVPHHAQAGCSEHEEPAGSRLEPEPARGKYSKKMTAREEQRVAGDFAYAAYHAVGSSPDLVRRLSSRAAITEEVPVRTLAMDLGTGTAFVCAVVPLHEVGLDDG